MMILVKRIVFVVVGIAYILYSLPVSAQDDIIFQALKDEIKRSKEGLYLPGYEKPFFISYALNRAYSFEMAASLGALQSFLETPCSSVASIRLLEGDYRCNNEFNYSGQFVDIHMPIDIDYDVIRRNLWLGTDYAYKKSLQEYSNKVTYVKENGMHTDDLSKIQPIESVSLKQPIFSFDKEKWETNLKELSAVFKEYDELFNSSVSMGGINMVIYKQTTEGTKMKLPLSYISISVQASTRSKDGVLFGDVWSVVVRTPDDLPSLEELKSQIITFADNLVQLREAPVMEEYYSGPILFEDMASEQVFGSALLNHKALLAHRGVDGRVNNQTLENRMGKKVIDSRLTIKNYSSVNKYKNLSLLGCYEIDAEGVVPAKEMLLVEDGILCGMLNGRFPTKTIPESTGSSRYALSVGRIAFTTAPGTLHVSVHDGTKHEKMKRALIKVAREEGLDYAYVVRKIAGQTSFLYKVNVKDGEETLVRIDGFQVPSLSKLKRLVAISAKERVSNYVFGGEVLSSIICPAAIIVEDIEINPLEIKKSKESVLEFPLRRKEQKY